MRIVRLRFACAAALLCAALLNRGGDAMAIDEARYSVLEREGSFELRSYEPQVVAETVVEGDFDKVGSEGFRRLFRYISGENRKKQSIAMTAPVSQQGGGEKIPMTAPVGQEKAGARWSITFLMPPRCTIESLPEPLDPGVKIKSVPARLMASLRYTGTWSRKRYLARETELRKMLIARGFTAQGEPVWARYNPPFTLWFLRRNEVLIPVSQARP
ncbi:MAG: heme-binding protein [Chlamydiota bacterium]